ncbi:MAG: hypothetical protein HY558_02350 [Euryarchaeota archaeon]|nr:hypothetical protein [Euryarchaeota archaeon]
MGAEAYKTVPVKPDTWQRLKSYKMGDATYDDVLNDLMDSVPVERFAESVIREFQERARTWRGGRSWRAIKAELKD